MASLNISKVKDGNNIQWMNLSKGSSIFYFFLTQKIWEKEKKYLPLHHQNNFKQTYIMCIRLNSIKDCPKVAESDMTVYKILEVVEDKATGKESYYSPISSNKLQYDIGKLYTEPIGKTEDFQTVNGKGGRIKILDYANTTTGLYSYKKSNRLLITLGLLCNTSQTRYKMFQCKVPKGSKYYASNGGTEIVSDNLVIISEVC